MGPINKDPTAWLPEMRDALRAIARALDGRPATPDLIEALSTEYKNAVPEHEVRMEWYPKGYMFLEERRQPAWPAEYGLLINGPRLISGWLIAVGDLETVLAQAC
jgi:hypothetical protein